MHAGRGELWEKRMCSRDVWIRFREKEKDFTPRSHQTQRQISIEMETSVKIETGCEQSCLYLVYGGWGFFQSAHSGFWWWKNCMHCVSWEECIPSCGGAEWQSKSGKKFNDFLEDAESILSSQMLQHIILQQKKCTKK